MNLTNTKPVIIALDHGYGNIKTAHAIFKTGVTVCEKEPTFSRNLLIYEGKYYLIGDEHKEFTAVKMDDQDYYILTLAAIGIELTLLGLDSARVHLAAGLPPHLGQRTEGGVQSLPAPEQRGGFHLPRDRFSCGVYRGGGVRTGLFRCGRPAA